MSRYTGSKCRLCRRQGMKLFLKGERCYTDKCAFEKRPFPPGVHKGARRRLSGYGIQLREKQKVRFIYGISENQFKNYFSRASKMPGVTGENLLSLLERRLDNVVFRMGLVSSRAEARQMVLHGHFLVNGKKVNIPSYLVDKGDIIEVSPKGKNNERIKSALERDLGITPPQWIDVDTTNLRATILREPTREDIEYPVQEQLIVEFYSK
ncbi:MAG TPA: 30S ribosomal protein S4 [Candidatus Atribacteria bacterium]|nr:30S ribosomal protein S4 [Candidatus Atribacteria bacterium]